MKRRAVWSFAGTLAALALVVYLVAGDGRPRESSSDSAPTRDSNAQLHGRAVVPAAAAAVTPSEPRPLAAREMLKARVCDLGTGEAVAGVSFVARRRDSSAGPTPVYTANADGDVVVPVDAVEHLRCVSEPWVLPRPQLADVRASSRLWIHATVRVQIVVRAAPSAGKTLEFSTVRVHVDPAFPLGPRESSRSTPFHQVWMNAHGLLRHTHRIAVDASGVAVIDAPRVRRMMAHAVAPGWIGRSAPFSAPSDIDVVVPVEVELHVHPRVSGRLVGHDGKPLVRSDVRVYARKFVGDWSEFQGRMEEYDIPGATFTAHSRKDGTTVLNYLFGARTDEDGRFDIDVRSSGAVTLVAHAVGHAPLRRSLGTPVQDVHVEEALVAPTHDQSRIAVTYHGRPVTAKKAQLVDFGDIDQQTLVPVHLDENGTLPASWFVLGRAYRLVIDVGPTHGGLFRWDGASSLEVSELVHELDEFLELR